MRRLALTALLCVAPCAGLLQAQGTRTLTGKVLLEGGRPVSGARIALGGGDSRKGAISRPDGVFVLRGVAGGSTLVVSSAEIVRASFAVDSLSGDTVMLRVSPRIYNTGEVRVSADRSGALSVGRMNDVDGAGIYEAKKSELITLDKIQANTGANTSRQVFSRIAGLNIWESDAAGIQLGIGGRGLSPNRTSHFNTRQNGYDISADALGYPESYYTPPAEALDRIEVVRGAASLQYGTQFGGLLNFVMRPGANEPVALRTRQTAGSYGFLNSFTQLGGTAHNLNYTAFYQYKRGDGWRPNSDFNLHMGYAALGWSPSPDVSLRADATLMHYLAHQPGGLTDREFETNPAGSSRARNWFTVDWLVTSLIADIRLSPTLKLNNRTFGVFSSRAALGNLERINVVDFGGPRTLIDGTFNNIGNETRLLATYAPVADSLPWASLVGLRLYRGLTEQSQGSASDRSDADFRFTGGTPDVSSYRYPGYNVAAFAEQVFRLTPELSIVPGVRFEWIQTEAEGQWTDRVRDFAGNVISETTYREQRLRPRALLLAGLGVAWRPSPAAELYANISQNYRSVTFSDLRVVNPNYAIDPEIKDERGWTADLGFRGQEGSLFTWDVSVYMLRYADRIGLVQRADQPPLYIPYRYRTNIGGSTTLGIEAVAEVDLLSMLYGPDEATALTLFVNASLTRARYDDDIAEASARGKHVELVPPATLRSGLTWRHHTLTASLYGSFVAQHYTDATNAERSATAVNGLIPSYTVFDLSARWKTLPWLALEMSVNNLFDQRYFTRRAEGYPGPGILPSDPRSAFLTVEIQTP